MPILPRSLYFRDSTSNGVDRLRDDLTANVESLDGVLYAMMGGLPRRIDVLGGAE